MQQEQISLKPNRVYRTTMDCGCIVITIDHIIKDWKFNCQPHKKMLEGAVDTYDQLIEDMIFAGKTP